MKYKKAVFASLAAAVMMFTAGCGQTQIGYVDVAKVYEEAPQMKATVDEANKKLEEAQKQAEDELAAKQDLTDEEIEKAFEESNRKLMTLNQMYATQLKQKLDVALGQIAREKKLDAIFENNENQKTVYLGGIDVTEETIAKLQ